MIQHVRHDPSFAHLPGLGLRTVWLLVLLAGGSKTFSDAAGVPQAFPRPYVVGQQLHRWNFADGTGGWEAQNHCRLTITDGVLRIHSTGGDPYLSTPVRVDGNDLAVRLRMRLNTGGDGQLFWSSSKHQGTAEQRRSTFALHHDDKWHEYTVPLKVDGSLTALRLDPGRAAGRIDVDWIAVHRGYLHPLELVKLEQRDDSGLVHLRNHDPEPIDARVNGSPYRLNGDETKAVRIEWTKDTALASQRVIVKADSLPPIERRFWIYRPHVEVDDIRHDSSNVALRTARDGSLVRLLRDGQQVAALAPLVHVNGRIPELELADEHGWPLEFVGEQVHVTLADTADGDLVVKIASDQQVEGPVVRVAGHLEQGLLAGVEYLGKGEVSSSRLDIETEEHLRFEPDPMDVTMPLMAVVTDRASVALTWNPGNLQPTFAAPDFLDFTAGHRMSLKGKEIRAMLRVGNGWPDGGRLEEAILWSVSERGLPELPQPPRSEREQMQLSLAAYRGLILDQNNGGWFHAVVPGGRRMPAHGAPMADCASAIFRISGRMPHVSQLQLGGAHVPNPTSFFVSGRADDWLRIVDARAEQVRSRQQPDGSYRYDGKFRRGHFEDTASGICGQAARLLLDHAYYTGNQDSLAAGLETLNTSRRFRTPRGAQTWEVPLHTPDILAAAHLVWAHVRAFELTGNCDHLVEARRWAVRGLPFVYQWSNQPIMLYATTPVYGATNWVAPNWIGLPVQWCGTVYAYALLLLSAHERTLDWRHVAEGILICGEQMQYSDGPSKGCLPDAFELRTQQRRPADINPGALVSLRLRLGGRLDNLAVATDGNCRVVAPFPVTVGDGRAYVQAQRGARYQLLMDGRRIVDVDSSGQDVVPLTER